MSHDLASSFPRAPPQKKGEGSRRASGLLRSRPGLSAFRTSPAARGSPHQRCSLYLRVFPSTCSKTRLSGMFSFLQTALITGLPTPQAHEARRSWGLQPAGRPASGQWLGAAPAQSSEPGAARRAGQGRPPEAAAERGKHTAVNRPDPRAGARGLCPAPALGEDLRAHGRGPGGASSLPLLPAQPTDKRFYL